MTSEPEAVSLPAVEATLTAIWCEVLERATIEGDQDFFELGGNSLQLVSFFELANQRLNAAVEIDVIVHGLTVKLLAPHFVNNQAG